MGKSQVPHPLYETMIVVNILHTQHQALFQGPAFSLVVQLSVPGASLYISMSLVSLSFH